MCVFCIPEASTGRLRRAVPKTAAKSSVRPGLPVNKSRSLPTRSESTLPQLLIPIHFKSRISNTYKKAQGEGPPPSPKVLQLVTTRSPLLRTHTNTRNPNPLYRLLRDSLDTPGVGYLYREAAMPVSRSPASHGSRNTGHRPRLRSYRCAATRKVPESQVLVLVRRRETNPLRAVSKIMRADIGSAKPERRPGRKAILERRAGVALARRPGSNVLTKHHDVDLLAGWSGQASNRAGKAGSVRMGQRPFLGPR
jgi:hypothetical protein